ncbi:bifunctional pyr operon transcriptional regulator/uracil phosphoribosyltransferase PyrR [Planctomycetota bacterium]
MKVLLNADQIDQAVQSLAEAIATDVGQGDGVAVVGIRSRGEQLGQRLATLISTRLNETVPYGALDITLYRDDLNDPHGTGQPVVRTTEIDFDIDNKTVVLVDDVLFTGRSTRAALDALIALGRPKAIRLAVLVDRAGREFPIQPDYTGLRTDVGTDHRIHVHLIESDGEDEVLIE